MIEFLHWRRYKQNSSKQVSEHEDFTWFNDTKIVNKSSCNVLQLSVASSRPSFRPDFVYEPVAAGWPPASECREVSGDHRLRRTTGIVIALRSPPLHSDPSQASD